MAITATQVKELREKTGAGMMDCKKALTESQGDFQKAIELLRKKGAAVAQKRAERATNEGRVIAGVSEGGKKGVMVEVNCETDFVAGSDDFINFSDFAFNAISEAEPCCAEKFAGIVYQGKNLAEELTALIGKIGEKIEISRFAIEKNATGLLVDYIHPGSKLAVLISADNVQAGSEEECSVLLKDIAMQIAAMKPVCIYKEEVSSETIAKEIEIYKELARKEGKPEQVLERIATGKLNKYYQENCLFEQAFVKDSTKTIRTLVEEFNKKHSSEMKLRLYRRFHLSDENK